MQRHEKNDGLGGYVRRRLGRSTFATSAGADEHLITDTPMCSWNRCKERCTQCARNPRQHNRRETLLSEKRKLLSPAAVDVGIPLFQAQDREAFPQGLETESQKFFLRCFGVPGEFAGDVDRCSARNEIEDWSGDEFIC